MNYVLEDLLRYFLYVTLLHTVLGGVTGPLALLWLFCAMKVMLLVV